MSVLSTIKATQASLGRDKAAEIIDAERVVISSILGDPDGSNLSLASGLPVSAFSDPYCGSIWKALQEGAPIDDPLQISVAAKVSLQIVFDVGEVDRCGMRFSACLGLLRQAHLSRLIKNLSNRMAQSEDADFQSWRTELESLEAGADASNPLITELTRRQFVPGVEEKQPRVAYKIGDIPVCTAGNLTNIIAQAKAGKSATIGAMLAAAFTISSSPDCLGFTADNSDRHALVHFDTEQSVGDWRRMLNRALRRAQIDSFPSWFRSYHLTGMGAQDCRSSIEIAINEAKRRFGGVFSVVIDGVADLVVDPNDPEECFPLITKLHALAIKFDCPIVNVIHLNPGSEKTRGHLGSQLERKAESNLTLEKNSDGSTVIYSLRQRGAMISKDDGPRFKWDDVAAMHVSIESGGAAREDAKRSELRELVEEIFDGGAALKFTDMTVLVGKARGCSTRTAERKISQAIHLNLINRQGFGLYAPSTVK